MKNTYNYFTLFVFADLVSGKIAEQHTKISLNILKGTFFLNYVNFNIELIVG